MTKIDVILALLLSLPAMLPAQQVAIGEYSVPTGGGDPYDIAKGPDGAMWFTENNGNKIGRITAAGAITEYAVPSGTANGITAGPDGALWFTEYGADNIGRITTAGGVAEYPLPRRSGGRPWGIAAGPDGALWFTEYNGDKIGRITTAGAISEYPLDAGSDPRGITAGPDGALWFTESFSNKIGRITTAGVVTEYAIPTGSNPWWITAGPDGALWFTEYLGNKIGRITTAGAITEYPVPYAGSYPWGITAGPDGALWFTEEIGNKIGCITTLGEITEYSVPSADSYPQGITVGPDEDLWFTEFQGNKIGEVVFPTAGLSVSPASGGFRWNLTFTGSGFAPNEGVQIYVSGVGSAVLATGTADSGGAFTATARAPQSPFGPRLFLGVGQSSGKLGAADFSVTPRLIMNPNSGTVGSTTAAQGFGFGAGETVNIYWNNPRTFLGTAIANQYGTFTGNAAPTFTVPAGAPLGVNKVSGKGLTTQANGRGSFTVE